MKNTIIAFVAIVLLVLVGCQKEKPEPVLEPCAVEQWGNIRIQNFSADVYKVIIPGLVTATVDGHAVTDLQRMKVGVYRVNFVNQRTGGGGFINDFAVEACKTNLIPIIF